MKRNTFLALFFGALVVQFSAPAAQAGAEGSKFPSVRTAVRAEVPIGKSDLDVRARPILLAEASGADCPAQRALATIHALTPQSVILTYRLGDAVKTGYYEVSLPAGRGILMGALGDADAQKTPIPVGLKDITSPESPLVILVTVNGVAHCFGESEEVIAAAKGAKSLVPVAAVEKPVTKGRSTGKRWQGNQKNRGGPTLTQLFKDAAGGGEKQ